MYQKFTLDNGIRVLVNELPHTRSATITMYVATGARYEAEPVAGISHFIEHMLFKGSTKRATAQEMTNYWVKVPYQHFDTGLDVLSDMLCAPLFDANEIEKERHVILEELRQTLDMPEELVFYDLDALMWLPHPLGRDVAGTPESVSAITRADLLAYVAQHYHSANLVVSVAGYLTASEIIPQLNTALSPLLPRAIELYAPFTPSQNGARWKVHNKKTEQAHVAVATWSYSRHHPDRYAVNVLNTILGDGM